MTRQPPSKTRQPLTIGLVAGEASGDNLGAALLHQLRARRKGLRLIGIGGPAMAREGLNSLVEMEALTVNGLVDPLLRLPALLRILLQVRDAILAARADCFVGIDFNVFNLALAGMLKKRGVRTIHYVSPSVWAWRQGRLRGIARKVDLMLALYPFEVGIYQERGIPVRYVGHPLAHEIAPKEGTAGQAAARRALGLPAKGQVIALLPGSRRHEAETTGKDFLQAAESLHGAVAGLVIPAANAARHAQLTAMLGAASPALQGKTRLVQGRARQALTACDLALVNSGTATLEAMLLRKPMVMSYRLGALTHALVARFMRTPFFALPNILAGRALVQEFLQKAAQPEAIAKAALHLLADKSKKRAPLMRAYDRIHRELKPGAAPGAAAADAVLEALGHVQA